VKSLLNGALFPGRFTEFRVDYGNQNTQEHDIMSENNGLRLIGEAFNVSSDLFSDKNRKTVRKMKKTMLNKDNICGVIIYNKDAIANKPEIKDNIHYLPIDISDFCQ
jgi:hypothetical protein